MNDGRSHIMAVTRARNDDCQEEEEEGEWRIVELVKRPATHSGWMLTIGDPQSPLTLWARSTEKPYNIVNLEKFLVKCFPRGFFDITSWANVK
ncbi:hypothetical protein Pelo_19629 [Pelomyxa schiedti]|nr:hypothetical protein Pelo_19629 [Pelomyxa schiedti]